MFPGFRRGMALAMYEDGCSDGSIRRLFSQVISCDKRRIAALVDDDRLRKPTVVVLPSPYPHVASVAVAGPGLARR